MHFDKTVLRFRSNTLRNLNLSMIFLIIDLNTQIIIGFWKNKNKIKNLLNLNKCYKYMDHRLL
jgi:hypothetical protein